MTDFDVADVAVRLAYCPSCAGKLIQEGPEPLGDDDELGYEIQPEWCPHCGWEPT